MTSSERHNLDEQIRTYILDKAEGPGSKIPTEVQLAEHFNVTRYRVRNVLNGLVHQGVITKTPRRGTIINKLDANATSDNLRFNYQVTNANLYESIEARIVIEISTIPLVVKRITPGQIFDMECAVEKMLKNKLEPRVADEADMEFHAIMLKASGNSLLNSFSMVISQLFHKVDYRRKYWNTETIERLALEHRSILHAIQDGDTELTIRRLKDHLHYTQKIEMEIARKLRTR